MYTISIALLDGYTDSGLSIALDVFRTANSILKRSGKKPIFKLEIVSAFGGRIQAASGVTIEKTFPLSKLKKADVLLVPGFWVESPVELDQRMDRPDAKRLIKEIASTYNRGAIIGSACAGAFLLAEAGILDDKEATTTWWLAPHFKQRRPQCDLIAEKALVVQDRVMTAGAVFAQTDVALHLVTRLGGPVLAKQCANLLLLDLHGSQASYMALKFLSTTDPMIVRLEKWIRAHLAEDFEISSLAQLTNTSSRTLARRIESVVGISPIGFVQRIRVEEAVRLLETTRLSLEEISSKVGYSDPNALRRLIRRETNSSPKEIRRRFSETILR